MTPSPLLDLVVAARVDDRGQIMLLDLAAADGAPLPAFEAGAHVELHVTEPSTGKALVRAYSLFGDPADRSRYRLGILKDPESRGGSKTLHKIAKVGKHFQVSLPRNLFPLDMTAGETLLIGGGIGVTPMLAMAHALHAAGKAFTLHYCTRTPDETAFAGEIAALPFADRIVFHHSRVAGSGRFDPARDLPKPAAGTHLYVCGPDVFMDAVLSGAKAIGYTEATLHKESFGADVDTSGAAFEVEAKRSGKTVTVPEGTSIAAALIAAGIPVALSCEEGVCGTCICDVLDGEPDHRDAFLTDDEKDSGELIALCCSRAKSKKLVLDI